MASPPQPPDSGHTGSFADLEDTLVYEFGDLSLLQTALTHPSYAVENGDIPSYERLEFLGDAVLELVTTEVIYDLMPHEREGSMTKLRASVVDAGTLGDVGRFLGLSPWVRLGVGEARSGGADRDSILSDVVEAILGAMFLDGGIDPVSTLIRRIWTPRIVQNIQSSATTDARSRLQELLARTGRVVDFKYQRSGPDHDTSFDATAVVDGEVIGSGRAGSKKAAAIQASADALASIADGE
jgi:ribonuclease-3